MKSGVLVKYQVGEVFPYTIPSFSVISVQLRRITISNYGRETTDKEIKANPDAPSTIQVFLCEDPRFNSLVVPTAIRVIDGCIVPMSTLNKFKIIRLITHTFVKIGRILSCDRYQFYEPTDWSTCSCYLALAMGCCCWWFSPISKRLPPWHG